MILPFSCDEITLLLRLERAVSKLALPQGYDGDLLADPLPQPETDHDLEAAYKLLWQVPPHLRHADRDMTLRMCRGAVWGRTRPEDRSLPPQPSSTLSSDAKLARERSRSQSRRASA